MLLRTNSKDSANGSKFLNFYELSIENTTEYANINTISSIVTTEIDIKLKLKILFHNKYDELTYNESNSLNDN